MASMHEAAFFCIPEEKLTASRRHVYCGLCLVSALLGGAGAAWQLYRWRPLFPSTRHRRKPSPNPKIVFSLALADLLACLAVVLRAVAMLVTPPPELDPGTGQYIPLGQHTAVLVIGYSIEGFTQYFYGATFLWTVIYATDIYMQLANKDSRDTLYQCMCWFIPVVTTAASLLSVFLDVGHGVSRCADGHNLVLRYLFNYLLIVVALVADPALYLLTSALMRRRLKESGLMSTHNQAILSALQRKFLFVIATFALCWLPNLVDIVIQIVVLGRHLPPAQTARFFPLWAVEAFLNPLQGLINCVVYGRHQLFRPHEYHEIQTNTNTQSLRESDPLLYTANRA